VKTFVAGATGATGRLLTAQLLDRGERVRAVVRSLGRVPEPIRNHSNLELIEAELLDLGQEKLRDLVGDCGAVASCLGHNLSWKGMFGPPYKLVTEAVRNLCTAVKASQPSEKRRFILMNTVGNRNRDLDETHSVGESIVIGLVRLLLPPQSDNEKAAEYLRAEIGQADETIEWAAVRPDSLIDAEDVSAYEIHPSPTSSPIFGDRKTSRINVAHFMADLITEDDLWQQWKGEMPVIYNKISTGQIDQ
jgi:nucleoside-diphosphate-sugar epimerase